MDIGLPLPSFTERRKTHLPTERIVRAAVRANYLGTGSPTRSRTPGKSAPPASLAPVRANTSSRSTILLLHAFSQAVGNPSASPQTKITSRIPRSPALPATLQNPSEPYTLPPASSSTEAPRGSHPAASAPPGITHFSNLNGQDLEMRFKHSPQAPKPSPAAASSPASRGKFHPAPSASPFRASVSLIGRRQNKSCHPEAAPFADRRTQRKVCAERLSWDSSPSSPDGLRTTSHYYCTWKQTRNSRKPLLSCFFRKLIPSMRFGLIRQHQQRACRHKRSKS